jgi:hypothetical protein
VAVLETGPFRVVRNAQKPRHTTSSELGHGFSPPNNDGFVHPTFSHVGGKDGAPRETGVPTRIAHTGAQVSRRRPRCSCLPSYTGSPGRRRGIGSTWLEAKGVQGRNIADGGHPTQVVLPLEGVDVLCKVRGWHRQSLPHPCLFLEPVMEDELEVKDEHPRIQANSVLEIHLVLEPRLHAFETAEHGTPGRGDSMPVTTQGTKEAQCASQLHTGFTPIVGDVALLVAKALSVHGGQGSPAGVSTEIIDLSIGMVAGGGTDGCSGCCVRRDDAQGKNPCAYLPYRQTAKVKKS